MSTEKTYNKSEFSKAAGFNSPSAIHRYINKGLIKNKKIYTQDELDKFMAKYPPKRKTKHQKTQATSEGTYSKSDISRLFERSGAFPYDLIKKGLLEDKEKYTEQDIEELIKAIETAGYGNNLSPKMIDQRPPTKKVALVFEKEEESKAFDPDFNPFEIIEEKDVKAEKMAWINKIIAQMKLLTPNSLQAVTIPASIFADKNKSVSRSKILNILSEAKALIATEPGFEDSFWAIRNHDNINKEYTHSTIKRIKQK